MQATILVPERSERSLKNIYPRQRLLKALVFQQTMASQKGFLAFSLPSLLFIFLFNTEHSLNEILMIFAFIYFSCTESDYFLRNHLSIIMIFYFP